MKKTWFLIVSFVMGIPLSGLAEPVKADPSPKVEDATSDADKAAARAAAAEADKWAATPPVAPAPAVPPPAPVAPPPPHRPGLNEMRGKLQSKSYDPKTLRILVDGGFNVEFTFDAQTTVTNGGHAVTLGDLEYNDELILRYSGKELYALEIERISKAPRPQ